MCVRRSVLLLFTIIISAVYPREYALADYAVNGKVEGSACSSYILFEICSFVDVIGLQSSEGLRSFPSAFANVREYNRHSKRCWVDPGYTVVSYKYKGEVQEGKLDFITFPCIEY